MVSSTTCIGRSESPLIEIKHIRHLSTKDVQVPNRMIRFNVGCDLDFDVIQEFGELKKNSDSSWPEGFKTETILFKPKPHSAES